MDTSEIVGLAVIAIVYAALAVIAFATAPYSEADEDIDNTENQTGRPL